MSSWSSNTENTVFIKQLFNGMPSLKGVEIQEITFARGKRCVLKFILLEAPVFVPEKWKNANAVHVELEVDDIAQVLLQKFEAFGSSDISMEDQGETVNLMVSGTVEFSALAKFTRVIVARPYVRDPSVL